MRIDVLEVFECAFYTGVNNYISITNSYMFAVVWDPNDMIIIEQIVSNTGSPSNFYVCISTDKSKHVLVTSPRPVEIARLASVSHPRDRQGVRVWFEQKCLSLTVRTAMMPCTCKEYSPCHPSTSAFTWKQFGACHAPSVVSGPRRPRPVLPLYWCDADSDFFCDLAQLLRNIKKLAFGAMCCDHLFQDRKHWPCCQVEFIDLQGLGSGRQDWG